MSYASRSMRTRGRLNGSPVPVRSQRPLRVSAICASVCSVASARTCSTTAAGVRRRSGAASGSGHSIRRVAPPRQRMDTRITSSRSRVTSSMSSRSIRLRSRAGVRGSCQTRGRSATNAATRSFISGVTGGVRVLSAPAYASSAAANRWSASFQCRSRLSATSRFSTPSSAAGETRSPTGGVTPTSPTAVSPTSGPKKSPACCRCPPIPSRPTWCASSAPARLPTSASTAISTRFPTPTSESR